MRKAQSLIDEGRPFEAHEVLEGVWKSPGTDRAERELWRGLAQMAVGLTHRARGNRDGARSLIKRSADSLAPYAGTRPHGIPVDGLIAWAAANADSQVSSAPKLQD